MKGRKFWNRLLSLTLCLLLLVSVGVQAAAAETAHVNMEQPQTGEQDGLILLLSAIAITGIVLLVVIRWGKKKFF